MNSRIKRYMIGGAVFAILIVAVFVFWRMAFFGVAELSIQGTHNPLTTHVLFEGAEILPSGEGGRTYMVKSKIGSRKIVVTGPFVTQKELGVKIEGFSDTKISTEVAQVSKADLAKTLLGTSNTRTVVETKVFGLQEDWFVIRTSSDIPDEERYFYLYLFDVSASQWKLIERGKKISVPTGLEPPSELVKYLDQEASD